eukprot:tig00001214_g7564.t1
MEEPLEAQPTLYLDGADENLETKIRILEKQMLEFELEMDYTEAEQLRTLVDELKKQLAEDRKKQLKNQQGSQQQQLLSWAAQQRRSPPRRRASRAQKRYQEAADYKRAADARKIQEEQDWLRKLEQESRVRFSMLREKHKIEANALQLRIEREQQELVKSMNEDRSRQNMRVKNAENELRRQHAVEARLSDRPGLLLPRIRPGVSNEAPAMRQSASSPNLPFPARKARPAEPAAPAPLGVFVPLQPSASSPLGPPGPPLPAARTCRR